MNVSNDQTQSIAEPTICFPWFIIIHLQHESKVLRLTQGRRFNGCNSRNETTEWQTVLPQKSMGTPSRIVFEGYRPCPFPLLLVRAVPKDTISWRDRNSFKTPHKTIVSSVRASFTVWTILAGSSNRLPIRFVAPVEPGRRCHEPNIIFLNCPQAMSELWSFCLWMKSYGRQSKIMHTRARSWIHFTVSCINN